MDRDIVYYLKGKINAIHAIAEKTIQGREDQHWASHIKDAIYEINKAEVEFEIELER